jgi:hypothetical protein
MGSICQNGLLQVLARQNSSCRGVFWKAMLLNEQCHLQRGLLHSNCNTGKNAIRAQGTQISELCCHVGNVIEIGLGK